MKYLCDTNILGELAKKKPAARVVRWATGVQQIHISVITVEEIHFGLAWKPNQNVQSWIESFIRTQCTVLPVTMQSARMAGYLRGQMQSRGITRTQADMLIAGTAHEHGLTLVTLNGKDFKGCGIAVLNPKD